MITNNSAKIQNLAKGISDLSSTQLSALLGQKKTEKTSPKRKAVVHADNIVLLNQ